ncbi:hypothetical protein ACZ91_27930 [Streptomyces regensis]|nr:hypothetical protein ACZ91_27930 [Streptomyces regensis]
MKPPPITSTRSGLAASRSASPAPSSRVRMVLARVHRLEPAAVVRYSGMPDADGEEWRWLTGEGWRQTSRVTPGGGLGARGRDETEAN